MKNAILYINSNFPLTSQVCDMSMEILRKNWKLKKIIEIDDRVLDLNSIIHSTDDVYCFYSFSIFKNTTHSGLKTIGDMISSGKDVYVHDADIDTTTTTSKNNKFFKSLIEA